MSSFSLPNEANNDHVINISKLFVPERKKIQRVPLQLKNNETNRGVYDPVIVSCGPYHHGRPQYELAQGFKENYSLDFFVSKSHEKSFDKNFYHGKILEHIHEIQTCYDDDVRCCDKEELAWIILFDACFIIHFLRALTQIGEKSYPFVKIFGLGRMKSIGRDLILSENQIPFWIIKFLLCLQSNSMSGGEFNWNELLLPFIGMLIHGKKSSSYPFLWKTRDDEDMEPYHFLDAILIYHMHATGIYKNVTVIYDLQNAFIRDSGYEFRSITNLNSKGIRLKVSTNNTLSFRHHIFYGELTLPPISMTNHAFVLFTNLIAYEMTNPVTDFYATSYINFMLSLIEGPNDVNILREAGVLVGEIGCAEEVYTMFKDLDTHGINNPDLFYNLKNDIDNHCENIFKTWIAELIHTHFHNPWTITALIAAFVLLCLTFLQTLFTIYPAK